MNGMILLGLTVAICYSAARREVARYLEGLDLGAE